MKYTVSKSIIQIIGRNWLPGCTCAGEKTFSKYDVENIRGRVEPGITRANVESWLCCNSGDFQSVADFYASIEDGNETIDIPWGNEESECVFGDCMSDLYDAEGQ